jgi:uroporphyrin-III C-methyltransferase
MIKSKNNKAQKSTLGKVYLVGAGPGAVDLITLRGAKLLAQADIVFHDALVEDQMLELCPQAIKVAVGKRCGKLSSAQQFINKRLLDASKQYKTIIRLKGGDPMLFGRADEEIAVLKEAGIEVEVVPGITAALAGAASLAQSLTLRGVSRSVAFITQVQGCERLTPYQPIANPNADTLVYYMGRKDAAKIAQQLITESNNHSEKTPAHILEAVSTPKERHWSSTLGELAQGKAQDWFDSNSAALIMIGEALRTKTQIAKANVSTNMQLESSGTEIDDRLQNGEILTNCRRRA